MSDSFDPDVVYHITYDGWPIQRQVSKDGQTNPIGFNDELQVRRVMSGLRQELIEEYMDDTLHTEDSASRIAEQRIKVVKQEL